MNMEYADSRSLSPEDYKALEIGKTLIKQMELIYKGDVLGNHLIVGIKFGGGIVKCSLDTIPTKVETQLIYDDADQPSTQWLHFRWNAKEQEWVLI